MSSDGSRVNVARCVPIEAHHAINDSSNATNSATTAQLNRLSALSDAVIARNRKRNRSATTPENVRNCEPENLPQKLQPEKAMSSVALGTSVGYPVEVDNHVIQAALPVIRQHRTGWHSETVARAINPDMLPGFNDLLPEQQTTLINNAVKNLRVTVPLPISFCREARHPAWRNFLSLAECNGVLMQEVVAEFSPQDVADLTEQPEAELPKMMETLAVYIKSQRVSDAFQTTAESDEATVPCSLCIHLERSPVNPEGGLARCTRHPHLTMTMPSIRRRCSQFETNSETAK